jgi:tight adherence protein C
MVPYFAIGGVAFLVAFAAVYLILGRASLERARLREVTKEVPASSEGAPSPKTGGFAGLDAQRLEEVFQPLRKFLGPATDARISGRMIQAGFRKPVHSDIYRASKIALPIVGAAIAFLLFKQNVLFEAAVFAAIGFLAPDVYLSVSVSRRKDKIKGSVPDALDLLSICVEAGLGLDQAVYRVGQEMRLSHPDLSDELNLVSLEQRAGKPRLDAWRHMADRTGVDVVRSLTNMLMQAERFGTPISRSLSAFSDDLRTRRRQQAEEAAAKTTIKMIPALVFFIFPSIFIVLLGPAIISLTRNLSKAFGG